MNNSDEFDIWIFSNLGGVYSGSRISIPSGETLQDADIPQMQTRIVSPSAATILLTT